MSTSLTLKDYLKACRINFEEIAHPYTETSMGSANSAHVAKESMAKGVLLRDDRMYTLAVLPSDHLIDIDKMNACFDGHFELASEDEIDVLYDDCDPGAVPPIGVAYGIRVLWDESLGKQPDIYFEGGDHRTLIHISGDDFTQLMADAKHATFSTHV